MSYQVLARKYRPKNFDTLVGQEHVVRALTHALESGRLHHAYLFTGTRGVGKTTLSRILAKSFNCLGIDGNGGITASPCGVCDACKAIDAGRFVDYIEMDAASNRGVDEMAQLLEQAVYAPSNARFKVYMIDEVHMLTNHAFNSMLKTLEEPPEHVKFILATTDPQKIPVTVLSRCLQFNLKQMPPGHIVSHLDNILGQEGISFETPALRLLAQGAHGSMRDALSLTDQAIAYAAGKVTLEAVQGMLGALDQSYLIRLLDALAAKDGAGLLAVADEMATRSLSYNAALQDLASLLHRVSLAQTVPAALPSDLPERDDVVRLATVFDAQEIQLFYQIAVHGRNELGLAPDEYAGFSMTLLRMLAFRPSFGGAAVQAMVPSGAVASQATTTTTAPARLNASPQAATISAPVARPAGALSPARAALEAARGGAKGASSSVSSQAKSMSVAATPSKIITSSVNTPVSPSDSVPPPWEQDRLQVQESPLEYVASEIVRSELVRSERVTSELVKQNSEPIVVDVPDAIATPVSAPTPVAMPGVEASSTSPVLHPIPELNWDGDWPLLAGGLPVRGVAQQLAQQSELITCDNSGGALQFHLRVAMETLLSAGSVDKLATALTNHFGQTVRVTTQIGAVIQTANAKANAERDVRQRKAEDAMNTDPFVLTMMREFGASIVPGSIKPI